MQQIFASAALLGLFAAAFWGIGDFSGGMASKSAGGSVPAALRVVLISHSASLLLLLPLAWALGGTMPHGAPLLWGIAAGGFAGLSVSIFYVALASGAMGASAALSGLLAAAVPAVVSAFTEGPPGWQHFAGFVIAGAAIWMIAAGTGPEQTRTVLLALLSGAGFGIYFVALRYAGSGGILWALAGVRAASITSCALVLTAVTICRRGDPIPKFSADVWKNLGPWLAGTAIFDTAGNLFFVAATRAGRLDIAAVLASLYPASTILLAGVVLKERPTGRQALGMAIAVVAVVLIAR